MHQTHFAWYIQCTVAAKVKCFSWLKYRQVALCPSCKRQRRRNLRRQRGREWDRRSMEVSSWSHLDELQKPGSPSLLSCFLRAESEVNWFSWCCVVIAQCVWALWCTVHSFNVMWGGGEPSSSDRLKTGWSIVSAAFLNMCSIIRPC